MTPKCILTGCKTPIPLARIANAQARGMVAKYCSKEHAARFHYLKHLCKTKDT